MKLFGLGSPDSRGAESHALEDVKQLRTALEAICKAGMTYVENARKLVTVKGPGWEKDVERELEHARVSLKTARTRYTELDTKVTELKDTRPTAAALKVAEDDRAAALAKLEEFEISMPAGPAMKVGGSQNLTK